MTTASNKTIVYDIILSVKENWYHLTHEEVLSELGSRYSGLTEAEAKERLLKYGPNEIARKKKISRSKVVSSCLQELAKKHRAAEMAEGYKAMANEQKQFAATASKIEDEVLPEWK